MARQEIILGTPPAGLGGDPPRTASMKINAMTQELYDKHAALGTASVRAAQTTSKAYSGELLRADLNGIGMMSVLEGTVYVNGVPADLFGTGDCSGFCSGGACGVPGMNAENYGVLSSRMHWSDTAGGSGNMQEWSSGAVKYTRVPASAGAWSPWQLAGAQLVGPMGAGLFQSVIERGSNANGEYVRFIDGTQICWCAATGYPAGVTKTGTYPMGFLTSVTTVVTASVTPSAEIDVNFTAWPSGAGDWAFVSTQGSTHNQIKIMAVGRWK